MSDESDDDRDAILERRNRFIKGALAGLAGASLVAACSGDVVTEASDAAPAPCLKSSVEAGYEAGPEPCLKISPEAGPVDAAADASADATTDDAAPMPCLSPLPPDSGGD